MSVPTDHLQFQWDELNQLNSALSTMRRLGIAESSPAFQAVFSARGAALAKLGLRRPSISVLLKLLSGLSPGELRLFRDAEKGWLVEAIESPGAPPVHRYVPDELAARIIKEELTHDDFMALIGPDDYLGE